MIVALATSNSAFAGYGVATIDRYFVDSDGWVYFGTIVPLPQTCSYFIEQFRFNGTTPTGKNMLATLTAAKIAGVAVHVWYTDSTAPGTNASNGCSAATMAVPTGIGIR